MVGTHERPGTARCTDPRSHHDVVARTEFFDGNQADGPAAAGQLAERAILLHAGLAAAAGGKEHSADDRVLHIALDQFNHVAPLAWAAPGPLRRGCGWRPGSPRRHGAARRCPYPRPAQT